MLCFGRLLYIFIFRVVDKFVVGNIVKIEEGGKNLVLRDRLKFVVVEYGLIVIVFYVIIFLIFLGLCYIVVKRLVIMKEKKKKC